MFRIWQGFFLMFNEMEVICSMDADPSGIHLFYKYGTERILPDIL